MEQTCSVGNKEPHSIPTEFGELNDPGYRSTGGDEAESISLEGPGPDEDLSPGYPLPEMRRVLSKHLSDPSAYVIRPYLEAALALEKSLRVLIACRVQHSTDLSNIPNTR